MRRIIVSLVFIASFSICYSQQKDQKNNFPSKPKLVIGIVVDQMRYDYIERYWNKFGDGGFKRLVNKGYVFSNCHYNYIPTETAPGHTSIYTGTTPSMHGIITNDWMNRKRKMRFSSVFDSTAFTVGIGTMGKCSPRRLKVTTMTDELKLATNFKSKVISIALKDRSAILPGGRCADEAYWYDDKTGNFISSDYYFKDKKLPLWVERFNADKKAKKYLQQGWMLSHNEDYYLNESTVDSAVKYEESFYKDSIPKFNYHFSADTMDLLKYTSMGNQLTIDFASSALQYSELGEDAVTDFLAISFSSTDLVGHQFGTNAIETEETYLKLDSMLNDFLKFVDKEVGINNTLIFLTADHGAIPNPNYLLDNKLNGGFVSTKRLDEAIKNLLGNPSLLLDLKGHQVYLNHDKAKSLNLNIDSLSEVVADFLRADDSIMCALTAKDFLHNDYSSGLRRFMQNGFYLHESGDVIFALIPGYIQWFTDKGTTHGSAYEYDTHVPLIFYGWKIKNGNSVADIKITDIAPSVCSLLQIEFPSGCIGKPIEGLFK